MRRREKRKFAWIIKLLIILFCLLMFSTIFALITSMNSNIISNVKINNIQVSGLDRMQTEKKFESIINKIMDEEITLKHGENEKKFTLKQMELETNINDKISSEIWLAKVGLKLRRRKALVTTQSELQLIAAAANIGLSFQPKTEMNNPAANGMPIQL